MRNKQVVLLIAGISGIATGIIVSLNITFIRQGLFYPASPVEIVVSLCLTFSVSVVFFVGAIVGWILVSEIYYSRMTGLNESSVISEVLTDILICFLFSLLPELFYGQLCTLFSMSVLIRGWPTRNYLISSICGMF